MTANAPLRVCHAIVQGRVQGVGFRWFARERARRLGLRGWVQNRVDGSVEIQASGPSAAVAQFLVDLSVGPKGASVSAVNEQAEATNDVSEMSLPFPFSIHR